MAVFPRSRRSCSPTTGVPAPLELLILSPLPGAYLFAHYAPLKTLVSEILLTRFIRTHSPGLLRKPSRPLSIFHLIAIHVNSVIIFPPANTVVFLRAQCLTLNYFN